MAQRRMFSLKIIDTDDFLEMPSSARLLYFDLAMRADDDGFISSVQKIIRITNSSLDDFNMLCARKYLLVFKTGICAIRHWRIHNLIRSDRYEETQYREEKNLLQVVDNKYEFKNVIPSDNQMSYQMATQDRLGKDRLGKDRLGIKEGYKGRVHEEKEEGADALVVDVCNVNPKHKIPFKEILDLYHRILAIDESFYPKIKILSETRKKHIKQRWNNNFKTLEDWEKYFTTISKSDFLMGRATTKNGYIFKGSLDWVIKESNCLKILEGNFSNYR